MRLSLQRRDRYAFPKAHEPLLLVGGQFFDNFSNHARREQFMKPHRSRRSLALFLAFLLFACVVNADSSAYRQSVEKWRHD